MAVCDGRARGSETCRCDHAEAEEWAAQPFSDRIVPRLAPPAPSWVNWGEVPAGDSVEWGPEVVCDERGSGARTVGRARRAAGLACLRQLEPLSRSAAISVGVVRSVRTQR